LRRWNPQWEPLMLDRSRSLEDRLLQFYTEYAARVFDYDWVRIFVSSGLKSYDLTERYLSIIRNKIIIPAVLELRHEQGKDGSQASITDSETELFWGLHGSIFYIAIRKFVYNVPVEIDVDATVRNTVRAFFHGIAPLKP
ncbi:MAG: TetR/AcrR family transcriptional regulator, partial [Allorhizobium sp.]